MLNEDLMNKWILALRSGEYAQTRGVLRRDSEHAFDTTIGPGYCCLGVLCDVLDPSRWVTPDDHGMVGYRTATGTGDSGQDVVEGTPPDDLAEALGLPRPAARELYDYCVSMNDGAKKSFSEIAEFLRGFQFASSYGVFDAPSSDATIS